MVLFYIGPDNPFSERINKVAIRYIIPLLEQNWALFAPNPSTSNIKFGYKCNFNGQGWTQIKDPCASILERHYSNRFGYSGKLYYICDSIIREVHNYLYSLKKEKDCEQKDAACIKELEETLNHSAQYRTAKRFVTDLCMLEAPKTFISLSTKFYFIETFPRDFSKRNLSNNQNKPYLIEFK